MAQLRLYRDPTNAKLGGVAAGIADVFGWDVTLVRVAWVLTIFLGGAGIIVYLLLWLIMPTKEEALRADRASDMKPAG